MKNIELLAPVGDFACLKAAIEGGANAIYFGLDRFNARIRANNFNLYNLDEVIDYTHLRGIKAYLTLNTLVNNGELEQVLDIVNKSYELGIDGIIVQDMGIASVIKSSFKDLALHASTQMTIYDLNGVLELEKLGFKRVVLAREMAIDKIEEIAKKTNIELEVFGHGALCVSYSGQCLMSSIIGGRSGNRGECAQPCRQEYNFYIDGEKYLAGKEDKYVFSMKDLCTIEEINDWAKSGIKSLKIEGRMKSPEYVFSVTQSYKKALTFVNDKNDQKLNEADLKKYMAKVFNRGGFTKGFLFNEKKEDISYGIKPNNCGVLIGSVLKSSVDREEVEIAIDASLAMGDVLECYSDIEKQFRSFKITKIIKEKRKVGLAYKGESVTVNSKYKFNQGTKVYKVFDNNLMKKIALNMQNDSIKIDLNCEFILKTGEYPILRVLYDDEIIEEKGLKKPEKALNIPIDKKKIYNQLTKTKSTTFNFVDIKIDLDEGLAIQLSELNDLRRRVLERVKELVIYKSGRSKVKSINDLIFINENQDENKLQNQKVSVQFLNWEYEYDLRLIEADRFYIPLEYFLKKNSSMISTELNKLKKQNSQIFFSLPAITKENYWRLFNIHIKKYLDDKLIDGVLISNIGQIGLFDTTFKQANYNLNVFNSLAVKEFKKLGFKGITYSLELNVDQLQNIKKSGLESEIVVYGRIPVMHCEHCLKKNNNIPCIGETEIKVTDKMGYDFPIICDKLNCVATVLNSKILYLKNDFNIIKKINADWIRLLVTNESQNQLSLLVNEHHNIMYKENSKNESSKIFNTTKGHYLRGV